MDFVWTAISPLKSQEACVSVNGALLHCTHCTPLAEYAPMTQLNSGWIFSFRQGAINYLSLTSNAERYIQTCPDSAQQGAALHFTHSREPATAMQAAATSGAGLVADTYLLAGSGAVLISLGQLAAELYGSKEMCLELIENVKAVEPRLEELTTSSAVEVKVALQQYYNLVTSIRGFLQEHVNRNPVARTALHWKMKKRVQSFYTELESIKTLVALDDMLEDANRHSLVMRTLQRNQQLNEQTGRAIAASLESLRKGIGSMPGELALNLKNLKTQGVVVGLLDLKKELKTNSAAYSAEEKNMLMECFNLVKDALNVKVPHVSSWYLSRSDLCFDEDSPFASSSLRELDEGTIFSGAKVTIKAVKVAPTDAKELKLFNGEVDKWYDLHDPHVLPLYGANNTEYPLLFVCARAEFGNFRDYLAATPHRVWELFLDAARGLAYLHKHKLVHGNLKCNNLLVTAQGVGVVSDFMFSFVRTNSALSAKPLPPTHNWKAPECYDAHHDSVNPRFESDVYSLGMCLFEALTGAAPYAEIQDEDAAIQLIKSSTLPTPPAGANLPDEALELINRMCCRQYAGRIKLSDVIVVLEALSAREKVGYEKAPCDCHAPSCRGCGRLVVH